MSVVHSLRFRLLVLVMLVVTVSVGAVGLLSRRGTRVRFMDFVRTMESEASGHEARVLELTETLDRVGTALQRHFDRGGTWADARPLLRTAELPADHVALLVEPGGERFLASDEALASADVTLTHDHLRVRWEGTAVDESGARSTSDSRMMVFRGPTVDVVDDGGAAIGTLYVLLAPETAEAGALQDLEGYRRPSLEQAFLGSVDRWILGAVIGTGIVALLLAGILAGRIVGPVEELTTAARGMGAGDLSRRVDAGSSGEIGELARAFNSMAASLERTERLRRDMVTDVAHELRTPLTHLRARLESVQDGLVEPTSAVVESLHEEVMLLNRLVDDLQELALADAGQLRLDLTAVDVGPEIERIVAAATTSGGAGIEMALDELPPVRADRQRLQQILGNLLANARRHTPADGRIVVRARLAAPGRTSGRARSGTSAPPDATGFVEVAVSDSGPGIAPEHLPNVFERFYRTDGSRQRATGGAGLGLAIVKQLVEAHGGAVWVDSEPGRGATFGLLLPVA